MQESPPVGVQYELIGAEVEVGVGVQAPEGLGGRFSPVHQNGLEQ
jgi:hypothetical protein